MLEELVPLVPVHFFQVQAACHHGKPRPLPSLEELNGTKPFADVAIGWSDEGITVHVEVKSAFNQPEFPHFQTADSIELFFDTRDVKTSGYNTRFCHHFFFLPEAVLHDGERVQAGEVTHFRTEDAHPLCESSLLMVTRTKKKIEIYLPRECLHGYDPRQFSRLGFSYRINRVGGAAQVFSAHDEDFTIEQQPSLWASLKLET